LSAQAITVACEGTTDAAVLQRLLQWMGFAVAATYTKGGKGQLDKKLRSYNEAAKLAPWLVVRDADADCAPALVRELLPQPADAMCFRLAVPQIEAWLLADRSRLATFLSVSASRFPGAPDQVRDAKAELVNLARHSRNRQIREDLVPDAGISRSVGPGYTARLLEFADIWHPGQAASASPSLASCIRALERFKL
jgi:hypothetical protein